MFNRLVVFLTHPLPVWNVSDESRDRRGPLKVDRILYSFHFTQVGDPARPRFLNIHASGYYHFVGEIAPERQCAFCLFGCWSQACPFVNAVCVNRFSMMKGFGFWILDFKIRRSKSINQRQGGREIKRASPLLTS